MAQMTKEVLRKACKDNGGYGCPELNEKIFLNFHGFHKIQNLEPYTDLKAIFLEGNCLDTLEGLPAIESLRCLFVQQNCLTEISHLEGCPNLDTLNVANNRITYISNLGNLTALNSLHAAHNFVATKEDMKGLLECPSLGGAAGDAHHHGPLSAFHPVRSVVDLSHNKIEDPECLEILKQMPNLRCIYLQGNPVVSNAKHYRKSMIASIKTLSYLDDRPVFELERICAEAWAEGGLEAEREARRKYKEAEEARERRNFEAMLEIKKEAWRIKRERMGLPPGDTDPDMDDISSDSFDVDDEEPPELVSARNKLAMYSARPGEEEPRDLTEARRELAKRGVPIQQVEWQAGGDGDGEAPGSLSESATAADFADPMLAFRALAAAQGGCDESARGSGPPVGSEGGVEGSREVAGAGAVGSAGGQGGAVATDDELDALD